MMMNNMMINNMANMMAEDTGVYELRNPEINGMRSEGWVFRLINLICRH
ncbi:MAG: hypothetical protein IKS55_14110 [Oscillospiraceae bacterium]|nr:hypothetical protein [Oscillospiraceae bacterium]